MSTDLGAVPRPGRAPSASACEPYRELIERALERGRNAMKIWQDLVDAHGFSARYASVRRFVQAFPQLFVNAAAGGSFLGTECWRQRVSAQLLRVGRNLDLRHIEKIC